MTLGTACTASLAAACVHRCPFWLIWFENRGPWFTWGVNQLPGPSIFPRRTPVLLRACVSHSPVCEAKQSVRVQGRRLKPKLCRVSCHVCGLRFLARGKERAEWSEAAKRNQSKAAKPLTDQRSSGMVFLVWLSAPSGWTCHDFKLKIRVFSP